MNLRDVSQSRRFKRKLTKQFPGVCYYHGLIRVCDLSRSVEIRAVTQTRRLIIIIIWLGAGVRNICYWELLSSISITQPQFRTCIISCCCPTGKIHFWSYLTGDRVYTGSISPVTLSLFTPSRFQLTNIVMEFRIVCRIIVTRCVLWIYSHWN